MLIKVDDPKLLPTRAHETDAGLDLRAADTMTIEPGKRTMVNTGVSVQIPEYHYGMLVARSSLSKKNLILMNSVGIIDTDYRGEIMAALFNLGKESVVIEKYERFAQLLVVPCKLVKAENFMGYGEDWYNTNRGAGGFGSTGT